MTVVNTLLRLAKKSLIRVPRFSLHRRRTAPVASVERATYGSGGGPSIIQLNTGAHVEPRT